MLTYVLGEVHAVLILNSLQSHPVRKELYVQVISVVYYNEIQLILAHINSK